MQIRDELMINIYRSGEIESQHLGSVAVVDFNGKLLASLGDPDRKLYLRSAAKPMQAIPTFIDDSCMKRFKFTSRERALMTGSINGEKRHQKLGQGILDKLGLTISNMHCGIHPPVDVKTADEMRQNGEPYTELCHNCAGNHLVMLALTVHRGWSLQDYTDPDHPCQREILKWISFLSGVPAKKIKVGLDGCTAPVHYLSMQEIALCAARLSTPDRIRELPNPNNLDLEAGAKVMRQLADDYWTHPEIMGGRNRLDSLLNTIGKGSFFAKGGGEGFEFIGVPSKGIGIGVKIMDGDMTKRAKSTATIETLHQLRLIDKLTFEKIKNERKFYNPRIPNQRGIIDQEIRPVFKIRFA
jgi:L-asparaginase II